MTSGAGHKEPQRAPDPGRLDEFSQLLLGSTPSLGRRDVTREVGAPMRQALAFWHALGFPRVDSDEEQIFTAADVDAFSRVTRLIDSGSLDETTALSLTRAFSRTADRLAGWQTQVIAEAVEFGETHPIAEDPEGRTLRSDAASGESEEVSRVRSESRAVPDEQTAVRAARRITELADELEPLLVYAWRRHLTATVSRMLADAGSDAGSTTKYRSVGFADLVNFSSTVRRLSERDISILVRRFEHLVHDVITAHGGRVIKTVGDEALFSTVGAAPAAAIALDLVDAMSEDEILPQVRVGVARGPVVAQLGDVFGTTVNRASRLTAIAHGGSVLVDAVLARELATMSGFELRGLRARTLRGVGPVKPSLLHRADPASRRAMESAQDDPDETSAPDDAERE